MLPPVVTCSAPNFRSTQNSSHDSSSASHIRGMYDDLLVEFATAASVGQVSKAIDLRATLLNGENMERFGVDGEAGMSAA